MGHANRIGVIAVCSLLLLAGGCTSKFQSDWKRSAVEAPADDHLSGRWKGSWKSDKFGHSGGLRCLVAPTGEGEGAYRARFDATYMLLLRFGYAMNMTADVREDETFVAGEQDLGKSYGGVYEYEGQADGKTFRLNYKTKSDYGHFTLK